MIRLTPDDRFALRANAMLHDVYDKKGERFDPSPVLKLFSPVGAATWLATELSEDGDTLFGLADLGFGCPNSAIAAWSKSPAYACPSVCSSSATCRPKASIL